MVFTSMLTVPIANKSYAEEQTINLAPTILHTPIATASPNETISIGFGVQDEDTVTANVYYRQESEANYTVVEATYNDGSYRVEIPASEVAENIQYYIKADDSNNQTSFKPADIDNPYLIKVGKPTVLTIAEARVLSDGSGVTVDGIVTADLGSNVYIQDETAGIILRLNGLELNVGDKVQATGKLAPYFNMAQIQLASVDDVEVIEANVGVPSPQNITSTDLTADKGEAFEGELVTVENVTTLEADNYRNYTSEDENGELIVRPANADWLTIGQSYASITGVVTFDYGEYKVYPRTTGDIVEDHSRVANVIASPNPQAVTIGTKVELSTNTVGADVYYTTDQSVAIPDTLYTEPITINEPTTIKAIAIKDGMEDSDIITFAYTIAEETDAISIADARNSAKGEEVTVEGIVTFVESGTLIYIQDETGGIKIDTYGKNVDLSVFAEGDKVKATGSIDIYRDEIEVSVENTSDIEKISSDNQLPEPTTITIDQVDDFQGQLIKLEQVQLTDVSDKYNFAIQDETGSTSLYHSKASNFDKTQYAVNDYYDVVGVAAIYNSLQVKLRDGSDMVKVEAPQDPNAELPLVFNLKPANMAVVTDTTPTISATIEKTKADIDPDSIQLYLDGETVTPEVTDLNVSYTPEQELAAGEHNLRLEVADIDGQVQKVEWYFVISSTVDGYHFYYGIPHSHTSFSDGKGEPKDAYAYARSKGLDFLIISDHSNWLDGVQGEGLDPNYEYNSETNQYEEVEGSEWYKARIQAEEFNATHDDFLALRGFEMTSSNWGHINVTGSDEYVEAKKQMPNLMDFYNWLVTKQNVVAAFNHPNWPDDSFNDLAYVPELDRMLNLIEVGNGAPPYSYARAEEHYFKALDNGWHVSAVNGQDNHSWNWGDPDNLTVVVAENLSEDAFINAMRNRRTYSTETRTLQLTYKANGQWMGSVLDVEKGDTINFEVVAEDNEVPIKEVQLITNGGNIIDRKIVDSTNKIEWNPSVTVAGGAAWYVVKVIHEGDKWGTSSPIYTPSAENDVKLTGLKVDPDTTIPGYETKIEATVSNMGIRDVSNIEVKFYKNEVSDFNLVGTDTLGLLRAKDSVTLSTDWIPRDAGQVKIIAKMTEKEGITTVTQMSTTVKVVASNNKTVLIDAAHGNADVPGAMLNIMELLRRYGYTTRLNEAPITSDLLANVDVVIINSPDEGKDFTTDEEQAMSEWVENGGSALIASQSNFNYNNTMMNSLMEKIGTDIRFNDDNIYEPDDSDKYSGGMNWSVYAYTLPETESGLNDNMEAIRIFSGSSLVNADGEALTNNPDTGLEILLAGNDTSYNANPGENAYVYNIEGELNGEDIPIIAKDEVGNGKIVAAGRHFYSDFEIVNDVNNTSLTLKLIDWMAGIDRIKTIEEVRNDAKDGDIVIVTVKGTVTSPTDNFFDVVYIQDGTSGVALYGSQGKELPLGTEVIATGVVKYFEGELEIDYSNFDYEILYLGPNEQLEPVELTTDEVMASDYTGMLVKTTGKVTEHSEENSYFKIDDGSGEAYIHVDGYLGADMSRFQLGDWVEVTGIASIGANGPRIRVRFFDDLNKTEAPEPSEDPSEEPTDDNNDNNNDNSDSSSDGSSNSSGSSSSSNDKKSDKSTVKVDVADKKVKEQLENKEIKNVKIEAKMNQTTKQVAVELPVELLKQVNENSKTLTIETGEVAFELQPELFIEENEQPVVLSATSLNDTETKAIKAKLPSTFKNASSIYDFNLSVKFTKPIKTTISFDSSKVSNPKKLGVYYFNEEKEEWEYVGGKITSEGKIQFVANHFSKYTVMENNKTFADIANSWAKEEIEVLAARNILGGMTEQQFAPKDKLTRAQFAAIIVRAFQLEKGDQEVAFADVTDGWYKDAVEIAASQGIVRGANGRFMPNDPITREEMAAIMVRILKMVDPNRELEAAELTFTDVDQVSTWAKDVMAVAVNEGLIRGAGENKVAPKQNATREQTAVILYRMLESLNEM